MGMNIGNRTFQNPRDYPWYDQMDDGMGSGGMRGNNPGIPGQGHLSGGRYAPASPQAIADYKYQQSTPGAINPQYAATDPRAVMAGVVRGQWGEFQNSTVPIIKELENMTTYGGNTGIVDGLKSEARTNAKAAFGSVLPDAQRDAASFGMALSPATAGTLERSAKLGQAAATVDGVNRANEYQQDLNRQIVSGAQLSSVKQG
jgi:hypothetical protein